MGSWGSLMWGKKVSCFLGYGSNFRVLNDTWWCQGKVLKAGVCLCRVTALSFHLGDCQVLSAMCFPCARSRLGCWDISPAADSLIPFSCPSLFQRTAHLHHQSPCLPNWPQHEEELGSCKQAGCYCFLFLWQHEKQLSDYQRGWSQGRRLQVPGVSLSGGGWDCQPCLNTLGLQEMYFKHSIF